MELLRKFMARPGPDKVLLVRAFALVSAVRLGLGVLPFQTVQRLVDFPLSQREGGLYSLQSEQDYQRRVIGAVEAIGRRLLGDKPCLVQALVAQRFMRQGGYDATLRIGVAKDGQELLAHAWLERNGRVVIGGSASPSRYKMLEGVT